MRYHAANKVLPDYAFREGNFSLREKVGVSIIVGGIQAGSRLSEGNFFFYLSP